MYFPSELTECRRNSEKADVYAMGATMYEFFTNHYFWHYKSDGRALDSCQV